MQESKMCKEQCYPHKVINQNEELDRPVSLCQLISPVGLRFAIRGGGGGGGGGGGAIRSFVKPVRTFTDHSEPSYDREF